MAKKQKKTKKTKKLKLNVSLNTVLTSVLYAVIGLLLIIMKGGSLNILMSIIGALFILMGIVDAVKGKDLVKGVIEAVIGIVILIAGWTIADIVLLVFGILLIIKGAMELYNHRKAGTSAILSALVTIVIGILLVVAKWALMDVMCIVAGIIFLINAVLILFGKKLKK